MMFPMSNSTLRPLRPPVAVPATATTGDDERWAAVARRDASFDESTESGA